MDQLHFDLWWRGLNLTRDAGTYLYNAESPWDNPLVTSRVHNTVTVDGREQMTRGGRFMTLDWFPAYSKKFIDAEEGVSDSVLGYHGGYHGVRHERKVSVFADERWLVEDKLISKEKHTYRLHWLLPDWEWNIDVWDARFEIRLKSPFGWVVLHISTTSQFPINDSQITLLRAGENNYGEGHPQPFDGWVSLTYGEKKPALSLAFDVQSDGTTQFTTEFIFPHES